ncbi:MAG: rod shape-determining protein MreD [Firmicutes bacterium]|nr:rod shape-determining protein MreD [Bacillota bacterium]MBQ9604929.1 rod shape-determining protein MreD [Bacillota bacterium]
MRYFLYFLSLLFNLVLQSTVLQSITLAGIKPNLMLIAIVSVSCLRGENEGAVYGFFGGLLQDCYFSTYIGSITFLYMLIGYCCGLLLKSFYRENFILPMGIAAGATVVYNFLYYTINVLLRGYTDIVYYTGRIILPETVYNALAMIVVYNLFVRVNNYLEESEKYKRKVF